MSIFLRSAMGATSDGPDDPYWNFRTLVMNFDTLTDAKGHPVTNVLQPSDGITGGYLNKSSANASYLTVPYSSADFNLAAGPFLIEVIALWNVNNSFGAAIGISGTASTAWNGTDGIQFYFGLYNGGAIFDHWSTSGLTTNFRAGSITYGVKTNIMLASSGSRMSMYINGSRVSSSTTMLSPVTNLNQVVISSTAPPAGAAGGSGQMGNGSRLYAIRVTKGSSGGIDPTLSTVSYVADYFPQ